MIGGGDADAEQAGDHGAQHRAHGDPAGLAGQPRAWRFLVEVRRFLVGVGQGRHHGGHRPAVGRQRSTLGRRWLPLGCPAARFRGELRFRPGPGVRAEPGIGA